MQITLQLFGAFRPFGDTIALELPDSACALDIRAALKAAVPVEEGLVSASRFATETEVLPEDAPLTDGAVLAIIPPVSGG